MTDSRDVLGEIDTARLRQWESAARNTPWTGDNPPSSHHRLVASALLEPGRTTSLLLTFDVGYHACGWWKNSDYDRCWHLSLTHPTRLTLETPDEREVFAWARLLWGADAPKAWIEGAASTFDPYRLPNVVHARLFVGAHGEPIIPEGEVYSPLRPWSPKALESIGGDVR